MYNRYIRTDSGSNTGATHEHPEISPVSFAEQAQGDTAPHSHAVTNADNRACDGITGFLRHMLDQFHLDHVDTGDLLLLLLLFLLFHEDADEELLIALGLMLIL